jgi:hypothetical protein
MNASTTVGGSQPRAFGVRTTSGDWAEVGRRAVASAVAALLMALLIGAIIAVSLGLGYESYSSGGPDRPPLPAAPAPAPPPA